MKASVIHLARMDWIRKNDVCVRGTAFANYTRLSGDTLALELPKADSDTPTIIAGLRRLTGFFAGISQTNTVTLAFVDSIRSIPLFYGQSRRRVYISDDANWVRKQIPDVKMDPLAREEFLLAGYVTGQDTLYPNVKQLQPGECLKVTASDESPLIETFRYYQFRHFEPADYNTERLRETLRDITIRAIERLLILADGRQIVIPLSGGYDSRLIATLIKKSGHPNVLCFTYGSPRNRESIHSRVVARALGLPWHFVKYSEELWNMAWKAPSRLDYQLWASGLTSIAHIQDWLAVKVMQESGLIQADAVFVPGHSGDFVAGSHVPPIAFSGTSFTVDDVSDHLMAAHYNLAGGARLTPERTRYWKKRIESVGGIADISLPWQFADACEYWDWQERQAKFICNSVRVYEHFGFSWWLPLWDLEFVRFWEEVPLALRRDRTWYVDFVQSCFADESNAGLYELDNGANGSRFGTLLRRLPILRSGMFRGALRLLSSVAGTHNGLPGVISVYPRREVLHLLRSGTGINGIVAHFQLADMEGLNGD